MTLAELIDIYPEDKSIPDRMLLLSPDDFRAMEGGCVQECRLFLLITRGSVTMQVGPKTVHATGNHFIDILAWDSVKFIEMSPDLRAWWLLPNYLFTNESLNGLKSVDTESLKDRHTLPIFPLTPEDTGVLEFQLQLLHRTLSDVGHYYRTDLCHTYFRSFMFEFGNIQHRQNSIMEAASGIENRQDVIVRSFLKLVWRYYKTEHNIGFYAEKLCLSSKHLSRVIHNKLGKTPYAVIRDEMLQHAYYLLKDTKLSIQEISADLHFSEMAAFCKFFKKHTGLSPTAYRYAERRKSER